MQTRILASTFKLVHIIYIHEYQPVRKCCQLAGLFFQMFTRGQLAAVLLIPTYCHQMQAFLSHTMTINQIISATLHSPLRGDLLFYETKHQKSVGITQNLCVC